MCSLEVSYSLATIFKLIIYLLITHIHKLAESYLAKQVLIFFGFENGKFPWAGHLKECTIILPTRTMKELDTRF